MPKSKLQIRQATIVEHKQIVNIAKQSKYTSAYSNMIFSGKDCYDAGRIRIAIQSGEIVGFTCFRHRKRNGPITVLYFVGVDTDHRNQGIGAQLMKDLKQLSPDGIELNVMKDNPAVNLYQRLQFVTVGEAYDGKALVLRLI
jgi:ribosomal protein S18 acetylase RimI-like enzyme